MRDEAGYRYACALDDVAFVCPLPVIADDFASLGYDIRGDGPGGERGVGGRPEGGVFAGRE